MKNSKMSKHFVGTSDLNFALRMIYFFRDYIIPSKSKNPHCYKLLQKSYFYLLFEKICVFANPLAFKYGLNALANGEPLVISSLIFGVYSGSQVLRTWLNGRRIVANSGIVKLAIMEISSKIFKALLHMDYKEIAQGTR